MYKIFHTTQRDFPAILRLLKQCGIDFKRTMADLQRAKKISSVFLACKYKKNIIGTVRAIFDGHYCMIYDLAIDPKFHNKGIGKLLMQEAERKLKKIGAKYAFLNSSNKALKFYKKIGYTKPKVNPMIKNLK